MSRCAPNSRSHLRYLVFLCGLSESSFFFISFPFALLFSSLWKHKRKCSRISPCCLNRLTNKMAFSVSQLTSASICLKWHPRWRGRQRNGCFVAVLHPSLDCESSDAWGHCQVQLHNFTNPRSHRNMWEAARSVSKCACCVFNKPVLDIRMRLKQHVVKKQALIFLVIVTQFTRQLQTASF